MDNNIFISVIMPSFLGEYKNCASKREFKFKRAVLSFVKQDYKNKELIIISDGCEITNKLYQEFFRTNESIKLIKLPKQPLFSGNVRTIGVDHAKEGLIAYLDSDDYFGERNHLSGIVKNFESDTNLEWLYMNDYWENTFIRDTQLQHGFIGASSICHKKDISVSWSSCNGYGHDWLFVEKLIKSHTNYKKYLGGTYHVCHIPNMFDF